MLLKKALAFIGATLLFAAVCLGITSYATPPSPSYVDVTYYAESNEVKKGEDLQISVCFSDPQGIGFLYVDYYRDIECRVEMYARSIEASENEKLVTVAQYDDLTFKDLVVYHFEDGDEGEAFVVEATVPADWFCHSEGIIGFKVDIDYDSVVPGVAQIYYSEVDGVFRLFPSKEEFEKYRHSLS